MEEEGYETGGAFPFLNLPAIITQTTYYSFVLFFWYLLHMSGEG